VYLRKAVVAPGVTPRRPRADRKVARGRYYEVEDLGDSEDGTQSDWEHSGDDSEVSRQVYSVHDSDSQFEYNTGSDAEAAGVVVRRVAHQQHAETGRTEQVALGMEAQEDSSDDERMIEVEVQRLRMQRRAERRSRKAAQSRM
jgi:hypothetical protein